MVVETACICNLLRELHAPLFTATVFYFDSVSVIYMSKDHVQHQCIKHTENDIHFFCDIASSRQVCVLHVLSRFQYVDIFTK